MTSPNKELQHQPRVCKRGHAMEPTGLCKECQNYRARMWYERNRSKAREKQQAYREENRDSFVKQQREYRQGRASAYCQHSKNWAIRNPEKVAIKKIRGILNGMIARCNNPSSASYHRYGGRGISVCERWMCAEGLRHFIGDMGARPSPKHTIDRIDNDGNYEPGNCKWATKAEQARNRSDTKNIEYDGITMCLKDWATKLSIPYNTLCFRIGNRGWSIERAFTEPASAQFRCHSDLCKRSLQWLVDNIGCQFSISESAIHANGKTERPDAIGWRNEVSYLIECKMSRSEFLADARKSIRKSDASGVGQFRYYMVPFGMIYAEEVPARWGLLYAGESISIIKEAKPFEEWNHRGEVKLKLSAKRRSEAEL